MKLCYYKVSTKIITNFTGKGFKSKVIMNVIIATFFFIKLLLPY